MLFSQREEVMMVPLGEMKVGVVGAGNMGSGIAQKYAQEGFPVVLVDVSEAMIDRGLGIIKRFLEEGKERGLFSDTDIREILGRITATTELELLADADLVVEAVFEDRKVKKEVFQNLDRICGPETIFATNTSSFLVNELAEGTSRPQRFLGLHYFYHPAKNRLLEVIPHEATEERYLQKALLIAKLHGKIAICVKDRPGFAVNRFFVPYLNEAVRLLGEGWTNIPTIDEAGRRAFQTAMGPFELMNLTGIPIAYHSTRALGEKLGPFYDTAPLLQAQMEKNEKWDLTGEVEEAKIKEVVDRIYGVCLGVAAKLVEEGVASLEDTDRGAKIGLRWARGPFEIMNALGVEKTYELVAKIAERYADFPVPSLLTRQKVLGRPFSFRYVFKQVDGDIAYITINRPEAMNALNEAVFNQLEELFLAAEDNRDVRVVVFMGTGKTFVAGADIGYFVEKIKEKRIEDIVEFTKKAHAFLLRVENSPKFTIALLEGPALGGGTEFALACQAIVATPQAYLSLPETGIGIYPGLGGMLRLSRQVGPELAKYYTFTGEKITAHDGFELGIIRAIAEPTKVKETLQDVIEAGRPDKYRRREIPERFLRIVQLFTAEKIGDLLAGKVPNGVEEEIAKRVLKLMGFKAPLALKRANEIIDLEQGKDFKEAIEVELSYLKEIFSTTDAWEGLTSIGKKRPVFVGK